MSTPPPSKRSRNLGTPLSGRTAVTSPVGSWLAAFLIFAVMISSLPMAAGRGDLPSIRVEEPLATPRLVDWHPLGWSSLGYRDFGIDVRRDRVLIVGTVPGSLFNRIGIVVANTNGNILANVSPNVPVFSPTIAVDPGSGFSFISSLDSHILRIDTLTGEVLNFWNYPFAVQTIAVRDDRIYLASGGEPIQILNATTGVVLGNFSSTPAVVYDDLLVDPTGQWLLASSRSGTLAIVLSNGTAKSLGLGLPTFAASRDGTVYACSATVETFGGRLHTFHPANGTLVRHPVGCLGSIAENPATGVVIDARGNLILPTGPVGRVLFLGNARFLGFGWHADGFAMAGVIEAPLCAGCGPSDRRLLIGTWDGNPRLERYPSGERLLNPNVNPFCVSLQSVSGMDVASVRAFLDATPTPLLMDFATSFDCVPLAGVGDGHHSLRAIGTDLLGQQLSSLLNFETDGTPPAIALRSSTIRADGTYELQGWANDSHLASVEVNSAPAILVRNEWTIRGRLAIGENSFRIRAVDTLNNWAEQEFAVEHRPPPVEYVSNATGHFRLPIPPGWTVVPSVGLTTGSGVTLFGPGEEAGTVVVTVVAFRDSQATSDPSYAVARAAESASLVEAFGGVIYEPAHPIRVANHSAATFQAFIWTGYPARYIRTAIIAPEWERTIFVTVTFPEASWASHREDVNWILQGFQIDPPAAHAPAGLPVQWIGGIAAVGIAIALAAVVLLRRRGRPPRTA